MLIGQSRAGIEKVTSSSLPDSTVTVCKTRLKLMLRLPLQAPESLELFIKIKNDYYQKMPNSR